MNVLHLTPAIRHDRTDDTAPTPIAALRQCVSNFAPEQRDRERGEELAFQAVLSADAVLTGSFTHTLNPVIAPLEWTGHIPVPDQQLAASAVTYLGAADSVHGWWLHYTQRDDGYGDISHVLTLIAPCSCGTYITVELVDEDHLIVMLDELDTEPGAPVDCDYRLRIRSSSYADPAHTSIEPPF